MTTLVLSPHVDLEQGLTPRCSTTSAGAAGEDSDEESSSFESCITDPVAATPPAVNGRSRSRSSSSSSLSSCCESEFSVAQEVVDLESGGGGAAATAEETKVSVHLAKVERDRERDCRICHLSLLDGSSPESGFPIELGCSCKDDLAAAHKHCAEAWFKIRGNKICEICGSTARNVVGVNEVELMEQWNEANETAATAPVPPHPAETRHFWQGHRFLNFLLACMVFAFVISWLFHFNVPS